jgi:hypothetical protein
MLTVYWEQAYVVRKHLQDIKIDVALFSETHLKSHMRFRIPYYDICRTDLDDGHKNETAVAIKKGILHTCTDIPPLLPVEATGVCIPIRNTEMLLAAVYKSPQRLWSDTAVTQLLGFRNKSILAGDLNAKHPIWNSKGSDPSGLKLLKSFVSSNFKISAPQCSTHYTPDGRGNVLNIVVQGGSNKTGTDCIVRKIQSVPVIFEPPCTSERQTVRGYCH